MNAFREKYKSEKKLDKERQKAEERIAKMKERKQKQLEKQIEKQKEKMQRKIKILENKERTKSEKKARAILWKKQTKKTSNVSDSLTKNKKEAYKWFQLYIRLLRSDEKGYLKLADNGRRVFYTNCDAGHIYSKHNFPHIAFEEINCYPISKWTNKLQGDSIWSRQRNIKTPKEIEELELLSMKKYDRTKFDKYYYKKQAIKYKQFCKNIREEKGL